MKKSLKHILGVLVLMIVALLIPNNVNAEKMSDEFKKYLNDEGKLELNSVRVKSGIEFVFEYQFSMDENGEYLDNGICYDVSEDMNSVDFTINCWEEDKKETHNVEIVYKYDEELKKQVDGYLKKIPKDLKYFEIEDLEVVNYWYNGGNMIDYSSQLKSYFDYRNFKMDFRAGGGGRFSEEAIGNAQFMYDGTVYGLREHTGIKAKYLIYIDESVPNTKEAVVEAVQKRIDDYLGKGKITIEFVGEGIYDSFIEQMDSSIEYYQEQYNILNPQFEEAKNNENLYCDYSNPEYDGNACTHWQNIRSDLFWQVDNTKSNLNSAISEKDYFTEEWNNPNGEYAFLKEALNEWYFMATMQIGDMIFSPEFIVVKDSSKMIQPSIKTADVSTNIQISTNELIPLDTVIQAKQLTSGVEYEKIIKLLDLTDNLTYDLKLYSNGLNKYITKLDTGEFEVRIPLPEEFKNKDLVVYYVNENGEKEPYEVEYDSKKEYAIFKTTHFSIYTLGYKETPKSNEEVLDNKNEEKVPETFDGITSYTLIGFISLLCLLKTCYIFKKENN